MKRLLFILFIPAICHAADPNLVDMTELTAVAGGDVIYIVDDPAGTPLDRKITVTNLFDIIDTSAELRGILGDETGTGVAVFGTSPTLTGATMAGVLDMDRSGLTDVYQQVVTVAKAGGDYTTIQGAIDAIADATTTKRYVVDILGAGRTNTIISGTSGTVLTFPANKCTVSEVGINVDYGTLGANSTSITSAGADSVLKDCDITVTKSAGDFTMNGITITAGSFRMSDCYFTYSDTGATTATQLTQSAVKQTGTVTNVILNNNEMTVSTTDTNDDLVGMETTATVTGTCLLANNVITLTTGAAASSATGIWAYGTCTGAIFNQNRLTVSCNASSYGIWIDSTAGGATIDTRHNEIIITSVGTATSCNVAVGDTWNSSFDKITAASGYSGSGTVTFVSAPIDGNLTVTGTIFMNLLDTVGAADLDYGSVDVTDHSFISDGGTAIIDGSFQFPVADGSPSANGELQYDSTTLNVDDGMMEYFAGGDTVYYMLAIPTLPTDAEDDYHAAYDKDTDRLYWKADAGAAGGDSISIDSVAVVDPDFQDTATINITDTVNVVTMDIIADSVDSAHYAAGSIDYEHLADDVISGAAAVGTFTSGDTFLVLEAGVGLREADYDDLPGAGATAYNSIGDPTGAGSISFDAAETAEYTSAFTANDFMTIKGTGAFGDFSVLTITQDTGNPIDGDLIHAYTADAEDDVDQLVLGNGLDDYVTFRVLEAGTFTIDVTSDGVAAVVIPDAITANGGITSSGTIEAATLTEGGTGVPNTGDNLSVFAATTSAQLYGVLSDETGSAAGAPLAVFNQAPTIDSPTFTTAITATDLIDSAHYVAASIDNEHLADNAVDSAELAAGSVDDAHIADDTIQEPALNTTNAAGAGTDNYLLSYNHAGTNFTWVLAGAGDMLKATYDSGDSGGVDVLTTVDSIYASDYVLLTGTAVGTAAPKTDGALTYDATSGTLAATEFSGGGSGLTLASTDLTDTADIIYEAEIDTFAELDTQVADKALVNKADGAVWLGVHDFGGGDLEIPQASP
ncbi:MAG: beta strand repeat-containing protein, partial [Planctomycetota bacterium]